MSIVNVQTLQFYAVQFSFFYLFILMTNLVSSINWYAVEGDHSVSIWIWFSGSSLHMPTVVELLLESMGNGGVAMLLLVIHVLERSCCLLAVEKRSNP